jgi:hypothetical protein
VTSDEIDAALRAAEAALAAGGDPDLGPFWRAVAAVKRDAALIEEFADRIGAVDQAAFARWATIRIPLRVGTPVVALAAVAGVLVIAATYSLDDPWNGIALVGGTFVAMAALHSLTHLAVGRAVGIPFTSWFWAIRPLLPPGVKTDYAGYLRVPPRARAWMHASGAITTKVVPFLTVPVGVTAGAPWWSTGLVLVIAVGQVVLDSVWSVRASDWKKFRREMAIARDAGSGA